MSTYGHAYRLLNVDAELRLQGIDPDDDGLEGLSNLMGMHMAFDPEYSAKLHNVVEAFGWHIAQRELPTLYAKMDQDERMLDLVVDAAEHYKLQLLAKLTLLWLARD